MPQSKHKQHREAHQPQWAAKAKQHQLTGHHNTERQTVAAINMRVPNKQSGTKRAGSQMKRGVAAIEMPKT